MAESFKDKLQSIQFAPSAMPSRKEGAQVSKVQETEDRWERDFGAYKRLRREGLQPVASDGAAALESRAEGAHQIEGRPDPKLVERVQEGS